MNAKTARAPRAAAAANSAAWTNGVRIAADPRVYVRLFCFPYAGGGASAFRAWPSRLPPDVQVCPIQLPGRENRWGEPAYTDLSPLVGDLADALAPLLEVPFALFGHSLGALIAFELTRELRRSGQASPDLLLVAGCRAPQVPDLTPPIHRLPEEDFVEELRKLNGMPDSICQNREYLGLIVPTLRADLALYETYAYQEEEPLSCPIAAFAGEDDGRARGPAVAAWEAQTRAAFSLRVFAGDHFFVVSAQDDLLRAAADVLAAPRR